MNCSMSDAAPIKTGRPSIFSPELAQTIFDRMSAGELLIRICEENGMPHVATFFRWLNREGEGNAALRAAYTRARHDQADFMVEDTIRIADDEPDGNRARTRILARQWLAAKMNAAKYSDKFALTGHDGGPLSIAVVRYDLPGVPPEQVPRDVTPAPQLIEHEAQPVDKTEEQT